jgi:hypothetical protein
LVCFKETLKANENVAGSQSSIRLLRAVIHTCSLMIPTWPFDMPRSMERFFLLPCNLDEFVVWFHPLAPLATGAIPSGIVAAVGPHADLEFGMRQILDSDEVDFGYDLTDVGSWASQPTDAMAL